jgi:O-antigen ligase
VVRPWYGPWALPPLAAAAAVALWLQPVEATVVAGAVGVVVFSAARLWPSATARFGGIAVVVLLLAPPLVAVSLPEVFDAADVAEMPQSHRHRVQIWAYALERCLERPLFGWGFDSSREVMGTGAGAVFADAPMSLHTHNITLQAWLELGIGGVGLIAALGWTLWRRAAALGAGVAPAALAGFAAWLVFAEISRGAWQSWWLAATWLFAVWLATLRRSAPP